jgi:hypothetical protein
MAAARGAGLGLPCRNLAASMCTAAIEGNAGIGAPG